MKLSFLNWLNVRGQKVEPVTTTAVGNAARDWFRLLIACAVATLLSVGVTTVALRAGDSPTVGVPPSISVTTIDREALNAALTRFIEAAAEFDAVKRTPPQLVDPSR